MEACARTHDIVALCDVDDGKAKNAREQHPKAAFHHDWRDLLDREKLDALVVSTPDHSHAAGRKDGPFKGYAPFHWRGFWDFGTGALGDMACHVANLPFYALDLDAPDWVEADSPDCNDETAPTQSTIRFHFPAKRGRGEVVMHWYDGGRRPPQDLLPGVNLRAGGFLLAGEQGVLYSPTDYGESFDLYPRERFAGFQPPAPTLPRSPGVHDEWLLGILNKTQPMANFEYAGPFTEAMLLGNLALRVGGRIDWDAANLRVTNSDAAQQLVQKHYRRGFELTVV
jgi:predicted dehydrogenase